MARILAKLKALLLKLYQKQDAEQLATQEPQEEEAQREESAAVIVDTRPLSKSHPKEKSFTAQSRIYSPGTPPLEPIWVKTIMEKCIPCAWEPKAGGWNLKYINDSCQTHRMAGRPQGS